MLTSHFHLVWGPLLALLISLPFFSRAGPSPTNQVPASMRAPRLSPDYSGVVLPWNLAPLNCVIQEPGRRYRITIRSARGEPIEVATRRPEIEIPLKPWRQLLASNLGEPLRVDIAIEGDRGHWERFQTVTNWIARDRIDPVLVYRLLKPLYNVYVNIGIYQRNLETFEQKEVLHGRRLGGACLNCHSFAGNNPDQMALHIRHKEKGNPMLLISSNQVKSVAKTAGYLAWHPGGQLLVYSMNKLTLFFHTIGETRDVFDSDSNLGLYHLSSNRIETVPALAQPERLETWPAWAPDGRTLYFCSARRRSGQFYQQIRYDLMRIAYDPDRRAWGEPEVVVASRETGLSATQPRVSPDGKYLLFCLSKYGHFPVYQPSSDLYLLDLATRQFRRLALNSDQSDSWHCWSSNGRWIVFSSKRLDGLFARPHFAWWDGQGEFSKPFVLPQKDPAFYDACVQTFNVPELVRGPVRISPQTLAGAVFDESKKVVPIDPSKQGAEKKAQNTPSMDADHLGANPQ